MTKHFLQELEALKLKLIKMSRLAQYMIENSIETIQKRNRGFAGEVFEKEKMVNLLEIEIDEQGHSLLALAQPVAADLRSVTTVLKINTDLERISDHAINIAERALLLIDEPEWEWETPLPEMALNVREILSDAIESFVTEDVALARKVLSRDDEVDHSNDALYCQVEMLMQEDARLIKTGMKLVRIGHDLERIGDLANNIAEDVVYMKQGKEVRHHIADFP